jgi:hypothetical protein
MKTKKHHTETLYTCPHAVVTVIRKTRGLRRFPNHDYACALFILKPEEGSRVRVLETGAVEFMPNFDELKSMLAAIDPILAQCLPESVRNKPRHRQEQWRQRNRVRLLAERAA